MFDVKQLQRMQQELQDRMAKTKEDLKTMTVDGTSGGGMVTATVNGGQELVELRISPDAIDPDDIEMLQDLTIAAVNNALDQSRELYEQEMTKVTGGIKIPGLM